MRKNILLPLFFAVLIFSFSSCSRARPKIEDFEWKMKTIVHIEENSIVYDAAEEESPLHPNAKIIDMTLVAKDGKIIVTDATNNKIYEVSYTVSGKNPKGTDYGITIGGKSGYATVAMTTYADGTKEPSLPITLEDYSIYFYKK